MTFHFGGKPIKKTANAPDKTRESPDLSIAPFPIDKPTAFTVRLLQFIRVAL